MPQFGCYAATPEEQSGTDGVVAVRTGEVWSRSNDFQAAPGGPAVPSQLLKLCKVISCKRPPHSWLSA